MWLNQDPLARSLTHPASTPEVCVHIYPPISISRTTQKYSTTNPRENNQKHSPIPILFQEMSALKKEIRGNKKGQVPGTSKKKKK